MTLLVFDIGGFKLRAGLWCSETRELLGRTARPSPGRARDESVDGVQALLDALVEMGAELSVGRAPAQAVGVAFPGPVDAQGRVAEAPTLWGERSGGPVELSQVVSAAFGGLPTHVINDLTAAGSRFAEPGSDFCLVTVSSGIGNKVFLDGRPILGSEHRGGELGHWRVSLDEDAPLCECGGRGHLGALASGRSTPHHFSALAMSHAQLLAQSPVRALSPVDPKLNDALARAFEAGDAFAELVVQSCARPLGHALANLHLAIGVERFLVMGGWAQALGERYLREVESAAEASGWGEPGLWTGRLEFAALDDDSGLIGMARYLERVIG